jgi:hypothetical protein
VGETRAIINGWFYATPTPAITAGRLLSAVVATHERLAAFMFHALVQLRSTAPARGAARRGRRAAVRPARRHRRPAAACGDEHRLVPPHPRRASPTRQPDARSIGPSAPGGVIDDPDAVLFLNRAELAAGLGADPPRLSDTAAVRRVDWWRQRRLAAPLSLGTTPRLLKILLAGAQPRVAGRVRGRGRRAGRQPRPGHGTGTGHPQPDEFDQSATGDVLVAPATTPATTPAWTILPARAAAVVTDGGTLAAHASLVAANTPSRPSSALAAPPAG